MPHTATHCIQLLENNNDGVELGSDVGDEEANNY